MAPVFVFTVLLAQTPRFVGNYITHTQDATGREVEHLDPPGAVRILSLAKNQRWAWRDMLIGFDGRWSVSGNTVTLTVLNGPKGKLNRPGKMVLKGDASGKRLVLVSPLKPGFRTTFVNDPQALRRLSGEMQRRIDRWKAKLSKPRPAG